MTTKIDKPFKSVAMWPKGTIPFDGDRSEDSHETYTAAYQVCHRLCKEGFGGEGKIFPVGTWVENWKGDRSRVDK